MSTQDKLARLAGAVRLGRDVDRVDARIKSAPGGAQGGFGMNM